jgi:transcriptional regulator with XRE-family HTH domain
MKVANFGEQVLAWRLLAGYTQPLAAHELGIHTASLNAIERGRRATWPKDAQVPELPLEIAAPHVQLTLLRRRLRLRQPALAAKLGVSVHKLRAWESGRDGTAPSQDVLDQCGSC